MSIMLNSVADLMSCHSSYDEKRVDKICNDLWNILLDSIITDNINAYYYTIKILEKCFEHSEKQQKNIQEKLFDIYTRLIGRTSELTNKQFQSITFSSILTVLEILDNNKKISGDFSEYIVTRLAFAAHDLESVERNSALLGVVNILYNLIDEERQFRFSASAEMRKIIGKCIYNIGIDCIENNREDGLRVASNSLGWSIISDIKQGRSENVKYYIQLAEKMLQTAVHMEVSKKTITFLVTLFTTVGMFCCGKPTYHNYLMLVIKTLDTVDLKIVYTAIDIRVYQNDMFDELFDGNTEKLKNEFLHQLNGSQKKKK